MHVREREERTIVTETRSQRVRLHCLIFLEVYKDLARCIRFLFGMVPAIQTIVLLVQSQVW